MRREGLAIGLLLVVLFLTACPAPEGDGSAGSKPSGPVTVVFVDLIGLRVTAPEPAVLGVLRGAAADLAVDDDEIEVAV